MLFRLFLLLIIATTFTALNAQNSEGNSNQIHEAKKNGGIVGAISYAMEEVFGDGKNHRKQEQLRRHPL